jgi:hypothetical protein
MGKSKNLRTEDERVGKVKRIWLIS